MEPRRTPDCRHTALPTLADMAQFVVLAAVSVALIGCGGGGGGAGAGANARPFSTPPVATFNTRVKYNVQIFEAQLAGRRVMLADINDNGELLAQEGYQSAIYSLGSQTLLRGPFGIGYAERLNDKGQAVGEVHEYFGPAMFCESNGVVVELSKPDGYDSVVSSCINNNGEIVGFVSSRQIQDGSAAIHKPVKWSTGGAFAFLPLPAGFSKGYAFAINDSGDAVGWVYKEDIYDHTGRAIIWRADGTCSLLPIPRDARGSKAIDINNAGQVLGYVEPARGISRPVIWEGGGTARFLALPRNYASVEVSRISDSGFIAGYLGEWVGGEYCDYPALWLSDGSIVKLPVPEGAYNCRAVSVNSQGTAIGQSRYQEGYGPAYSLVWTRQ